MEFELIDKPVQVMEKHISVTFSLEEAAHLKAVFGNIGGNHPGKTITEKLYWAFTSLGVAETPWKLQDGAMNINKVEE